MSSFLDSVVILADRPIVEDATKRVPLDQFHLEGEPPGEPRVMVDEAARQEPRPPEICRINCVAALAVARPCDNGQCLLAKLAGFRGADAAHFDQFGFRLRRATGQFLEGPVGVNNVGGNAAQS